MLDRYKDRNSPPEVFSGKDVLKIFTEGDTTNYINFKQYWYFKMEQGKVIKNYSKVIKKYIIYFI